MNEQNESSAAEAVQSASPLRAMLAETRDPKKTLEAFAPALAQVIEAAIRPAIQPAMGEAADETQMKEMWEFVSPLIMLSSVITLDVMMQDTSPPPSEGSEEASTNPTTPTTKESN